MSKADEMHAYEDALCHALMFSGNGADAEENLVAVLKVLITVSTAAGLENLVFFAEQQIIEMTCSMPTPEEPTP